MRIDFLRGIALLSIFIDHVPGNVIGYVTMRNFGLADAAELFVLLAGFSSMTAYGRCFERDGVGRGLRRVFGRCLHLYVFQIALLLATLLIVRVWTRHYGFEPVKMAPLLNGTVSMRRGFALEALPANLDILPLYIVLLGLFPLLYGAFRLSVVATLVASAGLWIAANLDRSLNLWNVLTDSGWFFDPLAWQFLFAIGAALAVVLARRDDGLPRRRWLLALAWGYLAFALIAAAPWRGWGLSDAQLIPLAPPDKTMLSPWRLADIIAFAYVALSSPLLTRVVEKRLLNPIVACGRHSLEVFSLGTLLSLLGRLTFRTFGTGAVEQLLVDGIGLAAMLIIALLLDAPSRRKPALALSQRSPA